MRSRAPFSAQLRVFHQDITCSMHTFPSRIESFWILLLPHMSMFGSCHAAEIIKPVQCFYVCLFSHRCKRNRCVLYTCISLHHLKWQVPMLLNFKLMRLAALVREFRSSHSIVRYGSVYILRLIGMASQSHNVNKGIPDDRVARSREK